MSERKRTQRPAEAEAPKQPAKKEPAKKESARKTSRQNSNRFRGDMTTANIIVTVLAVIANIAVIVTLYNTTRFANLSGNTFVTVNILCIVLLVMMNMALMYGIRSRTKSVFITGIVLMAALLGIGGYGAYALTRVNRNLDKMTGSVTKESVSTSLVVYSDSGTQRYTDVSQLDGRSVGYATGTQTATLGKNRIDSEKMNVSYSEYQDYSSLILALFNGEIECAILPTNYKNLFANESGMAEFLTNTNSLLDFESTVTVENTSGADKDLTKDPFTVLLIGNADGLSDTMILCSVNPISMKVTMSSLARDSYVPITCYGGNSSKLNAAHAVSRDCLISTIQNLVGVDIDYYVDTNFKGVVQVVDALGGIVVDSPIEFVGQNSDSERGAYTVWVPAGEDVLLNGEQALAFARERHLFQTGDFARQEHQQEVIEAILRKIMRTRDINTLLNVVDAAGENIQTNISLSQMTGFMRYALQKANRYYDQEHVEKIIQLQGSRVTGYSSGLWDEGLQMSLYIYRLWNGSLADTKKAIERNINMNSPISRDPSLQWSVNWDFYVPTISAETYNETIIPSTVPTTIGNYVGKSIGSLQSFCDANGIALAVTSVQDPSGAGGTILSQSVAAGTSINGISSITVTVAQAGEVSPTPSAAPNSFAEVKSENACLALNGVWSSGLNQCYASQADKEAAETAAANSKPSDPSMVGDANACAAYDWVWSNKLGRCYVNEEAMEEAEENAGHSSSDHDQEQDSHELPTPNPEEEQDPEEDHEEEQDEEPRPEEGGEQPSEEGGQGGDAAPEWYADLQDYWRSRD